MKLLLKRMLSLLPSKLPVGLSQFDPWANSIIELSGQFADLDSMKFALASQVLHLGAQRSSVPKNFFVQSMRKAAANQVASQVFQDIKQRQLEAQKAVQQQAEATALALAAVENGENKKEM